MALFSDEMLLQGHFPLKFWVMSSWKESHMSENECQLFLLQCSYEIQMPYLPHRCHHAQKVHRLEEACWIVVVLLKCTCTDHYWSKEILFLNLERKIPLIRRNMCFVNIKNTFWGWKIAYSRASVLNFLNFWSFLVSVSVPQTLYWNEKTESD